MAKILIGILLLFAAVYYMVTSYFSDVQVNKYSTLQAARESGAIERGWVPSILPESSYDIEETHNIDNNELYGRFSYREQDEAKVMEKLKAVSDMNQTYEWGEYFFKIDREKNRVIYRNRTDMSPPPAG